MLRRAGLDLADELSVRLDAERPEAAVLERGLALEAPAEPLRLLAGRVRRHVLGRDGALADGHASSAAASRFGAVMR